MLQAIKNHKERPLIIWLALTFALFLVSAVGAYAVQQFYATKMLPNTTINSISVGGLSIEEATDLVSNNIKQPSDEQVIFFVDDISISTAAAELDITHNVDQVATEAFLVGKEGPVHKRFWQIFQNYIRSNDYQTTPTYDHNKVADLITDLKLKVDILGEKPSAELTAPNNPNSIKINIGKPGRVLELEPTIKSAQSALLNNDFEIKAIVASTTAELTPDQEEDALERAKKLTGKQVIISLDADSYINKTLSDQVLVSLLEFPKENDFDQIQIENLLSEWAAEIGRPAQNAELDFDKKNLKVNKFVPHKPGLELDVKLASQNLTQALQTLENSDESQKSLNIPTKTTDPEVTLGDLNDLGITQRIGYGESEYDHSIPNRIYNVDLTTQRVTNIIIPPGEEFSFNAALGEVSARTGFRSAYVIKNGRTELGDGGGVCQVSTTLFRAVLNAGLKITRRLPHSYRVSYYELDSKPGVDATVYSGNVDFRFINDTDHHILIHGRADSKNLEMFYEIYGTSDGRTSQIVDHRVWDARPAPAPEYIDDPSLPVGTVRQVDWAAGGIKASFKNIIKDKDGKVISEEEYYSNYRPWSAKFLVGTGGS